MDFGIAAIHHGESVADLGTASDVSEVVSAIGEDQAKSSRRLAARAAGENPRDKHKTSRYDRIGATSSSHPGPGRRSPRSRSEPGR